MDAHINSLYLKKALSAFRSHRSFLAIPRSSLGRNIRMDRFRDVKDIQKLFNAIMQKPFGIVVVAILAPIVEEIVFRGAILRLLLECFSGKKAWIAIVISAVAFGLFHGNLAQAVNASFLGLILGWLYYRTKSIVPSMVLHLVNNVSTVVMTLAFSSNPDVKVIEMFGNNLPLAVGCLTVSALLAIGTFLLIRKKI